MELQSNGRPDRRLVERLPVGEAARVRSVVARNQPAPPNFQVTIVDLSTHGAGVRAALAAPLVAGRMVELGVDDVWSRARVVWSRPDLHGGLVGGVLFTESIPDFVPALLGWLRRDAGWVR